MKRAQVIGFSVALVAAVGAFFFAKSAMKPPAAPEKVEVQVNTTEVLVAGSDISVGQIVTEGNLRWVAWPVEAAGRGYITRANGGASKMRDISGSIARSSLIAGEPIALAKLVKPGQGGVLAAILPAGMRAVATKISAQSAAGSLILPNDHVDVILIREIRNKSGANDTVSDTLFRNVRVIAIGQQIETKEGKKSADDNAKTATLELTPRQAEMLALANKMGEITLTLRSIADINADPNNAGGMDLNKQRGNAVRVLRYGAKSRVYGVN
ncbi:MAG: Flp pilus assembly protein CpaB [Hyphomicrobium sp.]